MRDGVETTTDGSAPAAAPPPSAEGTPRSGPHLVGTTWRKPPPPQAAIGGFARARGVVRLVAFVLATLLLVPVFFFVRFVAPRRDRAVAALWLAVGRRLCGLELRVLGRPARSGALLVNHASWIDILVVGSAAPVHFVAKAEVSGWPMFGWVARISDTVFIERKRTKSKEQEAILRDRIARGQLLCLFPEGTSTDGLRVLPFKSALFSMFYPGSPDADADVDPASDPTGPIWAQPVSIHYAPPPRLRRDFYGWWAPMGLSAHIWEVLCLSSGGRATITFHPPIDPSTRAGRKALAEEVGDQVAGGRAAAERAGSVKRSLA